MEIKNNKKNNAFIYSFSFVHISNLFFLQNISSTCFPSTISRGDQLRKPFSIFWCPIHSFPKILPFIPPFALLKFKTFWDYPPPIDVLHSFIVVQFCLQNKIIPKALKSPGKNLNRGHSGSSSSKSFHA